MNVLSVASEVFPLIKTGGLADVAGALPLALAEHDVAVRTLLPGYPAVTAALPEAESVHRFDDLFGGEARLLAGHAGGLDLFVLDAPHLYARTGGIYGWPDDAFRFAALARVGALIGLGLVPAFQPNVVHVHDWQTGLVAAYLHYDGRSRPGVVLTIHNIAFQGHFPSSLLGALGLPPDSLTIDGVEYFGGVGYLKAGLQFADRITTVSPTYALEIRTPEFGMGLDGVLRNRVAVLSGILNGIDTTIWDPATDRTLPERFDANDFDQQREHMDGLLRSRAAGLPGILNAPRSGLSRFASDTTLATRPEVHSSQPRRRNKEAMQARFGLRAEPDTMLFAAITRLSWQKGIDLILSCIPTLHELGAQLAILGAGDDDLQTAVRTAAAAHPGEVACYVGYDEPLAHLVQAGTDALLVPSRFEPCGLTQLCALRYGAVPVVARTGGLTDTVIDASPVAVSAGVATGVQFAPVTVEMLDAAIRRAAALYQDRQTWRRMQLNGMRCDVSWHDPARRYAALYREVAH